jgi:hypothetical protein
MMKVVVVDENVRNHRQESSPSSIIKFVITGIKFVITGLDPVICSGTAE